VKGSPCFRKKGPGRQHRVGKGGGVKLRKRVTREKGTLLAHCPTNHSLDRKWHLSAFAVRERERANAR
jgi:hypothetical protein